MSLTVVTEFTRILSRLWEYNNAVPPNLKGLLSCLHNVSKKAFQEGLQHYDGLDTSSFRKVLLAAVTKCSPSLLRQEKHYHTIFDVTWELLAFVRDELQEDEKLSQVLTLTGTQINAQASTCEQYIREFWPDLGPRLLSFIKKTFDQ